MTNEEEQTFLSMIDVLTTAYAGSYAVDSNISWHERTFTEAAELAGLLPVSFKTGVHIMESMPFYIILLKPKDENAREVYRLYLELCFHRELSDVGTQRGKGFREQLGIFQSWLDEPVND